MKQKSSPLNKKNSLRDNHRNVKQLLAKPPFLKIFYASLLINLFTVVGVLALGKRLPPQLPLFYGLPEGQEQLTSKVGLTAAASSAFVIVLINAITSALLKNDFLRKTLILAGFVISLMSLITTTEIVLLVGVF
jgi:hypothetical protein